MASPPAKSPDGLFIPLDVSAEDCDYFINFEPQFTTLSLPPYMGQVTIQRTGERTNYNKTWVVFQMLDAIGRGSLLPTVLPAIMASLPDSDVASATGIYSFLRSFGFVWGITIPGIIFNAQFDRYSTIITDPGVRQQMSGGQAYQLVGGNYIDSLQSEVREQVFLCISKGNRNSLDWGCCIWHHWSCCCVCGEEYTSPDST